MSAALRNTDSPREPPYDIDIEQAYLGAILVDEQAYWRAASLNIVRAEDFYDPLHQRIYALYETKAATGTAGTPRVIGAALANDEGLQSVGGRAYLESLARAAPSFANTPEYARVLRRLSLRRDLIRLGEDLVTEAYGGSFDADPTAFADQTSEALYSAAHPQELGGGMKTLAEAATAGLRAAEEAWQRPNSARILTGLPVVDEKLGGLFQRRVTVLGAAASQGKSGLSAQIAISAARMEHGVFYQSIEEADDEIGLRYIGQESEVPANLMAEGRFGDNQWEKIVEAARRFDGLPFLLDDSSAPTVAQIRAKAMSARRRLGKLSLVVIDHLRLVRPADPRAGLIEAVDQITRDIKCMAKDLDVAVLLVSQFNRDFWKRAGHRPMVSDLYGGGSIEQNADHIWFLHREEYYLERAEPKQGTEEHTEWAEQLERAKGNAELFSVKRRAGPLGKAILNFNAPLMRFSDPNQNAQDRGANLFTEPLNRLDK